MPTNRKGRPQVCDPRLTVRAVTLLVLAAPLVRMNGAVAADASSSNGPNSNTPTLEEVTVTATRRSEEVLNLAESVTALSGDQLVQQSKDDMADYIKTVPGVAFQSESSGLNQVTIRGITGGFARAKAPVSFYVDDMPIVSDPAATPDVRTFDVDRIEVLRGPQGTLFGESAIGGVIRVISKQADPKAFDAAVQSSWLDYAHGGQGYSVDGMVNVPLVTDTLALRATVSHRDEPGFIDNVGLNRQNQNDLHYTSGRISLAWFASDALKVTANALIDDSTYGAYPVADHNYQQDRKVDEERTDKFHLFNITADYNMGWANLVSSSNYFKRTTARLFDLTDSFNGFLPSLAVSVGAEPPSFTSYSQFWQTLDINDESFAQELRLVSPSDQPFRWVGGLYFFHTNNVVGVDFLGTPASTFNYLRLRRNETYRQTAAFSEVEYDFAPQWTLVAGLRYTHETRSTFYDQSDDFPFPLFLPATGTKTIDTSYGIATPKVSVRFKPTQDTQVYALASRGFRGPGGNLTFDNSVGESHDVYGAETLWSFELGTKARLADGRVQTELAVYDMKWDDRQEVANPTAPPEQQYVFNAGKADIKGAEAAIGWQVTRLLQVGAEGTYLKSRVTAAADPTLIGKRISYQPNTQGSLFTELRQPVGQLSLFGRAEMTYTGREFFDDANTMPNGGYSLFNLSLGIDGARWGVTLYAKNLADKYIQYFQGTTATNWSIGDPRQIGITARYHF